MNQNSPLSFSNIFKRETKLAAYFIICLTLVVLSVSYALFFSVDDNSNDQVVTAGDLKFTYKNGDTISSSSSTAKNICFQPMTEEEAELYWEECSYKFSVQNTGTLNATYSLSLSALDENTISISKLKVILRDVISETEHQRTEGYDTAKLITELPTSATDEESTTEYSLLTDIELGARKTAVYEVQIYVDEALYEDGYDTGGNYTQENDDSQKKIDVQINGSGIVQDTENLDPDMPFVGPFDNPQETIDEETGNGLYKVEHGDLTSASEAEGGILTNDLEGWKQTEWRYAGPNPDNYVWFNCKANTNSGKDNCEKWRIIGLVNVKTTSNTIEQRLKIIRADSIGNYSWDYKTSGKGSSTSTYGSNDWTDSQLMEMLNGIYYNSQSGECWTGSSDSSSSKSTCNFTQTSSGVKGLNETARDMIDKEIIWNLGGWSTNQEVTSDMYNYERGTSVYARSLPFVRETEWKASNTAKASEETTSEKKLDSGLFRSIALPYPSDYGYATSGGSKGRAACFAQAVYNWKNDYADCGNNDWLKPASGNMWTLSPYSSLSNSVFYVHSDGYVISNFANNSYGVWPALYLSSKVSISGGTGTSSSPFQLTAG